jgi:translation initiation factor 4A
MDVECYACVGGHRHSDDIKALQDKQQLVVGTPGRMYDMIQRGALSTDSIQTYVLDEADETFSRGFNEQIYDIFKLLPQAQVVVTSGTMPQDVLDMTKLMRDPVQIKAEGDQLSLRGFKQFYISVAGEDVKIDILPDLLTVMKTQAVIFCNTRTRVEWLTEQFTARGVTVSTMHGDMRADHRHDIITVFHTNCSRVRILIATDMLARGLDVQQIPLVVNYDFPVKRETYIHRAVRKGFTINFITAGTDDVRMMGEVEQFYSTIIEKLPENFAGKSCFRIIFALQSLNNSSDIR